MVSEKVTSEKKPHPLVEIPNDVRWPEFEKRIKELFFRELLKSRTWKRGDTEVAEAAGVSPPTIANWFILFQMERPYRQRR